MRLRHFLFLIPTVCFAESDLLYQNVYIEEVFLDDSYVLMRISDSSAPIISHECAATIEAGIVSAAGQYYDLFANTALQLRLKVDIYADTTKCNSDAGYPHENFGQYDDVASSPGRGLEVTGIRIVSE